MTEYLRKVQADSEFLLRQLSIARELQSEREKDLEVEVAQLDAQLTDAQARQVLSDAAASRLHAELETARRALAAEAARAARFRSAARANARRASIACIERNRLRRQLERASDDAPPACCSGDTSSCPDNEGAAVGAPTPRAGESR
ncbi:hypothetical protein WM29_22740 [Burkholderia ubonensis]|uniref:hypothetical protein n=1 Tax=Burkholderia ubonensis TaxID=101571 RepID=UPI000841916B|nr:hypothetical protein [Burkholderia ubonensis]AOK61953.1 hypothetical protein WM29_22740 [Burkholderia ubonensis]